MHGAGSRVAKAAAILLLASPLAGCISFEDNIDLSSRFGIEDNKYASAVGAYVSLSLDEINEQPRNGRLRFALPPLEDGILPVKLHVAYMDNAPRDVHVRLTDLPRHWGFAADPRANAPSSDAFARTCADRCLFPEDERAEAGLTLHLKNYDTATVTFLIRLDAYTAPKYEKFWASAHIDEGGARVDYVEFAAAARPQHTLKEILIGAGLLLAIAIPVLLVGYVRPRLWRRWILDLSERERLQITRHDTWPKQLEAAKKHRRKRALRGPWRRTFFSWIPSVEKVRP